MSLQRLRAWVAIGVLVASGGAHATITMYTSKPAFLAAVSASGTDTFDNISNTGTTNGPVTRNAGSYAYTVTASPSNLLFGAGSGTDHWLSTNTATETILFNGIASSARAVGGYFFASDINGAFLTGINITVTALSGASQSTTTFTAANTTSFVGFVSDQPLTSLTVVTVQPPSGFAWPTVNDLVLAAGGALPPAFTGAVSRKAQGGPNFDLPLAP